MAYTTEAKIKTMFGTEHVNKWADVDNDGNAATITAHIAQCISWADSLIDSRLRNTYLSGDLQAATESGTVPTEIELCSTMLSGVMVRQNKGEYIPDDRDPYEIWWNRGMALLESIAGGERKTEATY
jgi:hypothetical protein